MGWKFRSAEAQSSPFIVLKSRKHARSSTRPASSDTSHRALSHTKKIVPPPHAHQSAASLRCTLALLPLTTLLLIGNVSTALGVVVQKLLNEIDVREHHPPAAVPPETELVHGIALGVVGLEEI
mmetsp:Transcript_3678/g.10467  ORF Transcript_3678/g.10467 Transcript_3678/m.10467 type:complete len:124 (+) Transcript_3678:183-554(+)